VTVRQLIRVLHALDDQEAEVLVEVEDGVFPALGLRDGEFGGVVITVDES